MTDATYVPPPGISLLFCSSAEIQAAPAEEREAYYRIVENLCSYPEDYGFQYETDADIAKDDAVDVALAGAMNDWGGR